MAKIEYPRFPVPGVPEDKEWELFNVSNYPYYKQKVKNLVEGVCPFCTIDPAVNTVELENESWLMWVNKMAPRSGQECQFIFPCKRHIHKFQEISSKEWDDLWMIVSAAERKFGLSDGVLLVRLGNPIKNAKSVDHLHFNYHFPIGDAPVEITIAKSADKLFKKLLLLRGWEIMRVKEEAGDPNPFESLSPEDKKLVAETLGAPVTAK